MLGPAIVASTATCQPSRAGMPNWYDNPRRNASSPPIQHSAAPLNASQLRLSSRCDINTKPRPTKARKAHQ